MISLIRSLVATSRLGGVKLALQLLWCYRRSIVRRSIPIFKKVKEWADDWISQGYQVDTSEQAQRFVRLSKAHGSLLHQDELVKVYKDLDRTYRMRPRQGKTRRRPR